MVLSFVIEAKRSHLSSTTTITPTAARTAMPAVLWPPRFGYFVTGTGVMVVPGTLNEISSSLDVPVATAGQPISAGAVSMRRAGASGSRRATG